MNETQKDINVDISDRVKWLEEHYSTFNNEMGKVQTNTEWLIWAVRWLIAGIGGSVFLSLIGVVITIAWR